MMLPFIGVRALRALSLVGMGYGGGGYTGATSHGLLGGLGDDDHAQYATASTRVLDVTRAPFNAVGDGVTDDRAAIQSAIDALPANGGVLTFPDGLTFGIGGVGLTTSKPIRWQGELTGDSSAAGGSRLKGLATLTGDLVYSSIGIQHFRYLVLDPNYFGRDAVRIDNDASDISFLHCNILHVSAGNWAIHLRGDPGALGGTGSWWSWIEKCSFGATDGGGIKCDKGGDSFAIDDNVFTLGGSDGAAIDYTGVGLGSSAMLRIMGNNIGDAAGGVRINNQTQVKILFNQMEQTSPTTNADSAMISLRGWIGTAQVEGNNLNGHNNADHGIFIGDDCSDAHIKGNSASQFNAEWLSVAATVDRVHYYPNTDAGQTVVDASGTLKYVVMSRGENELPIGSVAIADPKGPLDITKSDATLGTAQGRDGVRAGIRSGERPAIVLEAGSNETFTIENGGAGDNLVFYKVGANLVIFYANGTVEVVTGPLKVDALQGNADLDTGTVYGVAITNGVIAATAYPLATEATRGAVLKGAARADVAANATPDAPVAYTEAGMQTELDKLKANDDAIRTVVNDLLAKLRTAGIITT